MISLVNAPIKGLRFTKYPNDLASASEGLRSKRELDTHAFSDFTRPGSLHMLAQVR